MNKTLNLNFEQMKVISDKNKIEILNCFELEKPMTVTEISEKINITYSRINYHIKILEKVGLLEVVDTKIKSGIIEKYYLPTAEEFKIDKSIMVFENEEELSEYKKNIKRFYDSILKDINNDYKAWIHELAENNDEDYYKNKVAETCMYNGTIFLDDKKANELKEELHVFFESMIEKYGDKVEGTKAFGIGNFFIVKKNQEQYFPKK